MVRKRKIGFGDEFEFQEHSEKYINLFRDFSRKNVHVINTQKVTVQFLKSFIIYSIIRNVSSNGCNC